MGRNMSGFMAGIFWTGSGLVARKGMGLVTVLMALRLMPPDQFGAYVLFEALLWLFLAFCDAGLSFSSIRAFAHEKGRLRRRRIMDNALILRLALAILAGAAAWLCRPLFAALFNSSPLENLIPLLPVLIVLMSVQELFSSFLLGMQREKAMARSYFMSSALGFGSAIVFIGLMHWEARGLVYASVCSSLAAIFFQSRQLRFFRRVRWDKKGMDDLWRFGFPLQINSILSYVFMRADSLLLGVLAGPVEAAYYGVATKVIDNARQIYEPFRLVYYPAISSLFVEKRMSQARNAMIVSLGFVAMTSLMGAVVLFLFQEQIVHFLLTKKYELSGPLLPLLALGLSAMLMNNVLGLTLTGMARPLDVLKINGVATVFNLVGNLILIPLFGLIGAAAWNVLTHWISLPAYFACIYKAGFSEKVPSVENRAPSHSLCGVRIDPVGMAETLSRIQEYIERKEKKVVLTLNVHALVSAGKDEDLRKGLNTGDLNVPDGVPLLWASRFLSGPLKERVNGTDLLMRICGEAAKRKYRLFFLGAAPGVARKAADVLSHIYPGLPEIETFSPTFGFDLDKSENNEIVDRIKRTKPDILFLGLGFPRQEHWIWRNQSVLPPMVFINTGASFDFVSGKLRRAPSWMQRNGLEWLWRLFQEPRRLSARYFGDFFPFCQGVLAQFFRSSFVSE